MEPAREWLLEYDLCTRCLVYCGANAFRGNIVTRIRIHPGQSIGLALTMAERAVVCDSLVTDDTYIIRIRNAGPDKPEVPFTLDELDDLCGYVAAEANHCKYKKRQRILDGVFKKLEGLLRRYSDVDGEEEMNGLIATGSEESAGETANVLAWIFHGLR